MRIATVYNYHITRWKGVFRALKPKEVQNMDKTKNKP